MLIEPHARYKNAVVILLTAHHLDGPGRSRARRNAGPRQSQGGTGDSTITERDMLLMKVCALTIAAALLLPNIPWVRWTKKVLW
jgi:hypothetical protein